MNWCHKLISNYFKSQKLCSKSNYDYCYYVWRKSQGNNLINFMLFSLTWYFINLTSLHRKKGIFSRFKERILGKPHPYKGHFDIVESNGSITPVMSKNQNCLYHAVIQATENTQGEDINEKAVKLRNDVQKDVSFFYISFSRLTKIAPQIQNK